MGSSSLFSRPSEMELPLNNVKPPPLLTKLAHWKWWLMVIINIFLVLFGQSAATILGRFYYNQGGSSKWLQTLTLSAGFPILYLPLLFFPSPSTCDEATPTARLSSIKFASICIGFGTTLAISNLMYSYGLLYLSVSTYSLVCATQLAFNAVFSYFINSERFTYLTLNSVVLLTFSSMLLGSHSEPEGRTDVSGYKYVIGFILTLVASALSSFVFTLIELTYKKVIKSDTFAAVLNMQINMAMVSTAAGMAGLFTSGEWKELRREMEEFRNGRVAYVMIVVLEALLWQMSYVGVVGLVFKVSSLFANVINTLAIPLTTFLAVFFLHDAVDGIKVMSLLLALWGFVSYFYQHYIDYKEEEKKNDEKIIYQAF